MKIRAERNLSNAEAAVKMERNDETAAVQKETGTSIFKKEKSDS